MSNTERESMPYDVVIVGAGPAGLSAAIKIKQLDSNLDASALPATLESHHGQHQQQQGDHVHQQ